MYRFALRMTGNTWAAEEIVQDVFMTLMRDPKKYDAKLGALGAFLYGVARNRVMKHLERLPRKLLWKRRTKTDRLRNCFAGRVHAGDVGGNASACST